MALRSTFNKQAFNWGRIAAHDLAAVKKLVAPAQVIELKRAPTLDDIVTKRIAFLTDYQDAAYALQYSDFVNKVKAAEAAIADGKPLRLTEAVAKYLFKLMAYKDEYEVARLYTDGKFQKKLLICLRAITRFTSTSHRRCLPNTMHRDT
jgi:indolepyruvate ferredoxin oxidoreductase